MGAIAIYGVMTEMYFAAISTTSVGKDYFLSRTHFKELREQSVSYWREICES